MPVKSLKWAYHELKENQMRTGISGRFQLLAIVVALLFSGLGLSTIHAQSDEVLSDMELIEKVAELQRALEAAEIPKRDAAEKELVALGVRVLDYLEPPSDKTPTDAIARTNRVRLALEKIAVASVTKASEVTLKGKMTIDEAFKSIQKQTGNDANLHDETPDVFVDREIDVDLEKVTFWEALRDVAKKGDLVIDTYGGARGQIRLTPTQEARIIAANPNIAPDDLPDEAKAPKGEAPSNTSGIFDLTVTRVNSSRNLINPQLNYCNITVRARWEPRVTPISIDLPVKTMKAIDEYDNPITIANPEAVMSGTVQPEIPEIEFSIPIGLVDRQIETIKSLEAQIDAVLPGRVEKFKFKKIGDLAPGTKQTKAGATLSFDGIQKNEDLFGVTVTLGFDEEHNALESHQSWVYSNPIHLENEAGKKVTSIAQESVGQTNSQVSIRYYFANDPKNMTLFYETPALIVQVPVKISLKNIPLP